MRSVLLIALAVALCGCTSRSLHFDASISLQGEKPFGRVASTTADLFRWKGSGGTADSRYAGTVNHDISEVSRSSKSSRIRVILSYTPPESKEETWKVDDIYEIPFDVQVTKYPGHNFAFRIRISRP